MIKMLQFAAVALGLAAPVMALGAPAPSQMEQFYECVLPPALAVYHDATTASGHISSDMNYFKNKHPGAYFNETSWLYALYAKRKVSMCTVPAGGKGANRAASIVMEAEKIIDGYLKFTWSPTRMELARQWPKIQSGYDKIRTMTGSEFQAVKVPKGVITSDGKYDAMINMQMAQMQPGQNG